MRQPPDKGVEPLLVRRRARRPTNHLGRRIKRIAKRTLLYVGILLAVIWIACVALRPYLLDRGQVTEIRHLSDQVAAAEAQNKALRKHADALQTPKGVEVEARRLGWVQPGEVLIQTSETPPPPPAKAPETRAKTPPLGAVQEEGGLFRRAYSLASRALRGGHRTAPTPDKK